MPLLPYIQLARPDHWFKNVFMAPGILLVFFFSPGFGDRFTWLRVLAGVAAVCLVASSNYVLNEILDADKDRLHPDKRTRPLACGQARVPVAYAEWLLLALVGLGGSFALNLHFGLTSLLLWLMGLVYNVPPVRLKDQPYLDVLSESFNNLLRLSLGWYATGAASSPPLSVLLAYWMFGAFLMALKRFAEFRHLGDATLAAGYRRSFAHYTEARLLESTFFYAALFGMFSGVFIARYHIELVLATPLVAYTMAYYMHLGFKPDSSAQHPERLLTQRKLMALVVLSFGACAWLLMVDIPVFRRAVFPWQLPPAHALPLAPP